jgi:Endonuclease NucS C-terminal domain
MTTMKKYYKVMLGQKSKYADEAKAGNFIGADFLQNINLKQKLPDNWREFNKEFIPVWLGQNPGKTRIGAGLACGQLWTIAKGIQTGDIVLSPTGNGSGTTYMVGDVVSDYEYAKGLSLPHRRNVNWFGEIDRSAMGQQLRNSSGGINTVIDLTKYAKELELLIEHPGVQITTSDDTIEDPTVFALEKHLEDFLVDNWNHTDLGKDYDIYESDGEIVGQQFPTDTGPIDILAISKDKKSILVIELKKGRISDVVVGQIQRYMGYVKEELADKNQEVKGVIIALEDDLRLRRALSVTQNIEFMTYEIKFKLNKKAF